MFPFLCQQMAPAKQMKILQEFQKQSAQMDMTVSFANATIHPSAKHAS